MTKMNVTKTMTEKEFRARIAEIQKQRETMEVLDKLAEQEVAKRKLSGPPQRIQPVPRYVQPQPPLRGLLAPEPTANGFMGILRNTPDRSKH